MNISPSIWTPKSYSDLIGKAADTAAVIAAKVQRMNASGQLSARWMFAGPPGVGKTALAEIAAFELAGGERLNIERKSGLLITIDVVKGWINSLGMASPFGGHQVKLIHEMDRVPPAAQDLLLDYLDQTRDKTDMAFIGTSNAEVDGLQERFQTRLQYFPITGPKPEEIAKLLLKWDVGIATANMIAMGCCGNVRQALLDLESHLDVQFSRQKAA